LNGYLTGIGQLGNPVHELGATTVIVWSIILVQNQRFDPGKARLKLPPAIAQTINYEITGQARGSEIEKKQVVVWQKDAKRCHAFLWTEVMV
jgi:hypothetical protein